MGKKKIQTYDQKKGRLVTTGVVRGDTYIRVVSRQHYMRVFKGYGISYDVFKGIKDMGVNWIQLIKEDCKAIKISIAAFEEHKIGPKDYGHGKQVFCPERYFKVIDPQQGEMFNV